MARRFQRRQFHQRRLTNWVGGVQTGLTAIQSVAASTSAIVSALDTRVASGEISTDFTIVRLRGILNFIPTDISVDRNAFGAFGVCLVNGEAFDAGVASVISPWTESFDDRWLYHTYWSSLFRTDVVGTDAGASAHSSSQIVIDSKSMRKVQIGDVMIVVIENVSSTAAANFITNMRILIKLS